MNLPIKSLSAGCCFLIVGCTTQLKVYPDGKGPYIDNPLIPQVGQEYSLPSLQYSLKITRTLSSCDNNGKPEIGFDTQIEATPEYVPGEHYVVDYQALSSWSKVTGYELETYDSGVIKSINASAQDQSDKVVAGIVKSGLSIFQLASGIPGVNAAQPLEPNGLECSPKTVQTLADAKSAQADLKLKTERLQEHSDTVARLERLAAMGGLDYKGKQRLDKSQLDSKAAQAAVKASNQVLEKLIDRLSVIHEEQWLPLQGDTGIAFSLNEKETAFLKDSFVAIKDGKKASGITWATIESALTGQMALRSNTVIEKQIICEKQQSGCAVNVQPDSLSGIYYRNPVQGKLIFCPHRSGECAVGTQGAKVVSEKVLVPQLSPLRILPFRNGIFQDNEIKASFRESGGLSKLNVNEKAARAVVMSESAASALNGIVQMRDRQDDHQAQQATRKQARQQASLDALDNEISILEKQKKINELSNAALSADQFETTRLNARLALLEAQQKTAELEASHP